MNRNRDHQLGVETFSLKVSTMSEPAGILIEEKKETTCIESSEVVEKLHENHCYELKTLRDNAEKFTLKENDPNSGKPETEILINEEKEKSNEGQRYGCEHENSEKRSDEQSIGYANQGSENGYELDMGKNNPGENSISDDEESFLSCRSNSECSYYRSSAPKKISFQTQMVVLQKILDSRFLLKIPQL